MSQFVCLEILKAYLSHIQNFYPSSQRRFFILPKASMPYFDIQNSGEASDMSKLDSLHPPEMTFIKTPCVLQLPK